MLIEFRVCRLDFHVRIMPKIMPKLRGSFLAALARFLRGFTQVAVTGDVVPVENIAGAMAADGHGHLLRDAGPYHVPTTVSLFEFGG